MLQDIIRKLEKLRSLDKDALFAKVISSPELQSRIIELNQQQMQAGLGADGNSLPKYEDDPFFKTVKQAKAYEAWKAHISPNQSKPREVMDFYITGVFQSTPAVKLKQNEFVIASDAEIADDVQNKTSGQALGLTEESLEQIRPLFYIAFMEEIKRAVA